ncbi:MAG: hypothetical protein IPG45_07680 [Deltaproteobacteria bacterium]|jgi:hypothetical protein|nr:hypothetical protein [Deltaproteobacteria bacterium]
MSFEVNNHRNGWTALNQVADEPEPKQKEETLGPLMKPRVALGKSQVDAESIELEQRVRVVGRDGQPLSKEQVRGLLEVGLVAAVELGEQQAHAAQQSLDLEAMAEAKRIAAELGKTIGEGNLSISRHQPFELPGPTVNAKGESAQLLGTSLANRLLGQKLKALLDPVLMLRGLSISFTEGRAKIELTRNTPSAAANQEVKEAFGLGLNLSAGRKAEIEALGQKIGASFLTQLVLKAKVAETSGSSLLASHAPEITPRTRAQGIEVPVKLDIKSFGDDAAALFQGLVRPEVTRLWEVVSSTLEAGIKLTTNLEQLPLPYRGCDAKCVTFGLPIPAARGPEPRWGRPADS